MSVDREAAGAVPKGERELRSKTTGWLARIVLVMASVLVSLTVLEVGYRLVLWGPEGLVNWPNLARQRMGAGPGGERCQYAYSAAIGWTSPANCVSALLQFRCPRISPLVSPGVARRASHPRHRLVLRQGRRGQG